MGDPFRREDGAVRWRGGNARDEPEGSDQARLSACVEVGEVEDRGRGSIDASAASAFLARHDGRL
jgi:hypothetical protein